MTSSGIRYSNIDALHESSARDVPLGVSERPSLNQCSCEILPVRDRDEAGEPRFRRQHVVVRAVEASVDDVVADREELPLGDRRGSRTRSSSSRSSARLGQPLGALDQILGASRARFDRPRGRRSRRMSAVRRSSAVARPAHAVGKARDRAPATLTRAAAADATSSSRSGSRAPPDARTTAVSARSSQIRGLGRPGDAAPARQRLLDLVQRTPSDSSRSRSRASSACQAVERHRPAREIVADGVELLAQPAAIARHWPTPVELGLEQPSAHRRCPRASTPLDDRRRFDDLRAGPTAASADSRPGCRCRPSRCRPAPAARASLVSYQL